MAWAWGKAAVRGDVTSDRGGRVFVRENMSSHSADAAEASDGGWLGTQTHNDQGTAKHTVLASPDLEPAQNYASEATAPLSVSDQEVPVPMLPDSIQRNALMRRMAASFGDIVGLLMQAPQFKQLSLDDLEWLVLPALRSGQCLVMERTDHTTGTYAVMAVALWARVSENVEQRIIAGIATGQPTRLAPTEWVSGDRHWLVATIGVDAAVKLLLLKMRDEIFHEIPVGVGLRTIQGGRAVVSLLAEVVDSPNASDF